MSRIDAALSQANLQITSCPLCARFVVFTRLLLASGFVMPGLVKLFGHRFTILSTDTPVGAFFEALYQTGAYWRFLGLMQILAAVLVLIPRFALAGAGLFFGIALNIVVLTSAIGFAGTQFVALLMLAATMLLLFWDYPVLRPVLGMASSAAPPRLTPTRLTRFEWTGAILATTIAWFSTLVSVGLLGIRPIPSLAIGAASACFGGVLLFGPVLRERWWPKTFVH